MRTDFFLFCGGPAFDDSGLPKPLMKVTESQTLLACYLEHFETRCKLMPTALTLLCDSGQEKAFKSEIAKIRFPIPIGVIPCGSNASTFEKLESALCSVTQSNAVVQFGYPDIFFFGDPVELDANVLNTSRSVHISAAALTSRFPRLIVDLYNNEVKGISNYSTAVPANPMYVFGGDLWGNAGELSSLLNEFKSVSEEDSPTLEYDFFFWLINNKGMRCVMLTGERIWIDSVRDVRNLRALLGKSNEIC